MPIVARQQKKKAGVKAKRSPKLVNKPKLSRDILCTVTRHVIPHKLTTEKQRSDVLFLERKRKSKEKYNKTSQECALTLPAKDARSVYK